MNNNVIYKQMTLNCPMCVKTGYDLKEEDRKCKFCLETGKVYTYPSSLPPYQQIQEEYLCAVS